MLNHINMGSSNWTWIQVTCNTQSSSANMSEKQGTYGRNQSKWPDPRTKRQRALPRSILYDISLFSKPIVKKKVLQSGWNATGCWQSEPGKLWLKLHAPSSRVQNDILFSSSSLATYHKQPWDCPSRKKVDPPASGNSISFNSFASKSMVTSTYS